MQPPDGDTMSSAVVAATQAATHQQHNMQPPDGDMMSSMVVAVVTWAATHCSTMSSVAAAAPRHNMQPPDGNTTSSAVVAALQHDEQQHMVVWQAISSSSRCISLLY